MNEINVTPWTGTDASANQASQAFSGTGMWSVSATVVVATSGSVAGTLGFQVSNTPPTGVGGPLAGPPAANDASWTPAPGAVLSVTGQGSYVVGYEGPAFRWFRLAWFPSGGSTGTLNGSIYGYGA
jgi:hypothetical protein